MLMSEENFDEQFLQLDSNVNVNHRSPGKDESNQMNALEQALQDGAGNDAPLCALLPASVGVHLGKAFVGVHSNRRAVEAWRTKV